MPHSHSVTGQTRIVAEYQAHLEQVRLARLAAEQDEKVQKKSRAKTFESYLSHEQNPDENRHQNPGRDPQAEAESSSEKQAP